MESWMPIDPAVVAWSKVVEFNTSSVRHNKHVIENSILGRAYAKKN
jgi:hypothetical protein